MLKNIKNLCENCDGKCSVQIQSDITIGSCDRNIQIGYECFRKSKLEMMQNPFNEMGINTKESSYVRFLREQEKEMMKIHSMRSNSIEDICRSNWDFSMDMYKRIDLLFIKWSSWYNKLIIMFKYFIISGNYCPYFKEFIVASIKDYYEGCDDNVKNEISDIILEVAFEYFSEMKLPVYNGDFIEAMQSVTKILAHMYKIMIIEYAQEEQLYNFKTNILYYSPAMRELDMKIETGIIEDRISKILENFDDVELRVISNGSLTYSDECELVREIFYKHSHLISNYYKFS